MTTATTSAPGASLRSRKTPVADTAFRIIALGCGLLVLAILVLIGVSMTNQAMPAFRHVGLKFVTSEVWDPGNAAKPQFGALAFIWGTLLTSVIALALAVPVSLGIALFLTELAPAGLRTAVIYLIDLLAAVPSVVYGLWGILVLAPNIAHLYTRVASATHGIPVLKTAFAGTSGRSFMTAGLIVALMITPIITSLSREVFATIPRAQKEAALALGATRWEMMRTSVLGAGRSGVIGAVMLGLGRAMGETIAVALVIGSFPRITLGLFKTGDAMASVIANQFGEANGTWRSALIGLGVVLFALTIVVNVFARALIGQAEKMGSGA
jgi:phosphate transport system permease protein